MLWKEGIAPSQRVGASSFPRDIGAQDGWYGTRQRRGQPLEVVHTPIAVSDTTYDMGNAVGFSSGSLCVGWRSLLLG